MERDEIANPAADASQRRHEVKDPTLSGEWHAYLLQLADALRSLSDPVDVQETAARVLGEALQADRVFYMSIAERDGRPYFIVERIYQSPSAPMLPAESEASVSNRFTDDFKAGRTVIVDDISSDPRMLPEEVAQYRERKIIAWVNVPLIKSNRLVASLVVHQCAPRHWSSQDIVRIEETAERTWAAVERARAEERLRRQATELAIADHNKSQFINILSHELRTPLSTITLNLDMLEMIPDASARVLKTVKTLKRQTEHLTRIVNDLLDISRIANNKMEISKEPVDLVELLRRCVSDYSAQFQARCVTLVSTMPESPVFLQADAVRMMQVFGNLLQNALKFTRKGDAVSVSASVDTVAGIVCIVVSDNGIGIAPDLLPRIFEPFLQADQSLARSHGGLGLGLSIVRGIVESHGGTIEALSEGKDRGTSFVIHLPLK